MLSQPADVDLDLIKTIAFEEEQITTDLSEEKLLDKVVQLYPRLRYVASMEETTTYEDYWGNKGRLGN